ncbi:hypothetical protein [Engelhardtia mirabilis]|uniref:Uncharacterized protein n=1 Tax=Engelhardtia mirabilis TaxID=2528011 RepID=A0A518BKE3_9BACT|nr:hypothetical protein Pla133_25330 [Planctomycetes bacterium Pla133]QDV01776.1 hypothetical protein Pla86_25320 [Planctomycetes bacterium Pla86]
MHRRLERVGRTALVVALALGLSVSCKMPGEMVVEPAPKQQRAAIPPADVEALEQLRLAVADGEDAVARGILTGILARDPIPEVEEAAQVYRRILDGREFVSQLDLRLVCSSGELPNHIRLEFVASSTLPVPVTVHFMPPTLVRRTYAVSPGGLESRNRRGDVRTDLAVIEVPAGGQQVAFLGEYPRAVGGALAVREHFELHPAGAWIERNGELLPAQDLAIREAERTSIAGFLPPEAVPPGSVVDYVSDPRVLELPDDVFLPALLERAVRVAPSERRLSVDLLAAAVPGWSDDQVSAASPALRWLTDAITPGSDPRAWRSYLAAWSRPPAADGAAALVLPR